MESAILKAGTREMQGMRAGERDTDELAGPEGDIRPSILLVDDTPANLLALEAVLGPLGHRLVRASSGEEALRCMVREEFCLVLVDVQMPGMDGFETAALIKSQPRIAETPLMFMTALSAESNLVFRGYSQGAVDYLTKPFDPHVLRSKVTVFVDLYLRGKKLQQQERLLKQQEIAAIQRRGEERYRGLAESVPVIVWAVRPDGTIEHCNQSWVSYAGQRLEGSEVTDPRTVHPEDLHRVQASWLAARKSGTPWENECRLRRHDGEYRWHLARGLPERDASGTITAWVVTATDIDERRRTEDLRARLLQQEHRARQEAEAANRAKDEFLATVSHELRSPLNAIVGWVQMLRGGKLDRERAARALDTIARNASVQKALVEDILDVSRIIAGKMVLEAEAVELSTVVEAAIETSRPAAAAKGVSIRRELSSSDDQLLGDARRLQQAVGNLLSNAVKFTPAGGAVDVRMWPEGGAIFVRVTDSGIGIHKDFLPHVFDRFRQADGSSTRAQGGLGLGLAIVRHIVDLHGGDVSAESDGPGSGATFTLTFPAAPRSSERSLESAKPLDEGPRLDGLRVLFVDDEPDARDLAMEFLMGSGASTEVATSAAEAFTRLREVRPHVLISDIGLPHEDGLSLIRRVRALPDDEGGNVPAIAVTGFASPEDAHRALTAGFQEHLPKPLELDKLLLAISRLGRSPEGTFTKKRHEGS